ncbi:MAG: hypothetical protein QGF53_09895 [Alphaproteobacteria bacterium]|jgi:hypothetical protein|nr:hypothetical protein [Alphaproteobacteria bacterium]
MAILTLLAMLFQTVGWPLLAAAAPAGFELVEICTGDGAKTVLVPGADGETQDKSPSTPCDSCVCAGGCSALGCKAAGEVAYDGPGLPTGGAADGILPPSLRHAPYSSRDPPTV